MMTRSWWQGARRSPPPTRAPGARGAPLPQLNHSAHSLRSDGSFDAVDLAQMNQVVAGQHHHHRSD